MGESEKTEPTMKSVMAAFLLDEEGQNIVEYSLLLAFMTLASGALFLGSSTSVSGIWSIANNRLVAAHSIAS